MQLIFNDKTYIAPPAKGRMVRKAIEMTEKTNFNDLKSADLDNLVDYVAKLFGDQFTIDELYDGLDADKLIPTIMECINSVVGQIGAKAEQFPNVPTES